MTLWDGLFLDEIAERLRTWDDCLCDNSESVNIYLEGQNQTENQVIITCCLQTRNQRRDEGKENVSTDKK